jgi:hypothetical protein
VKTIKLSHNNYFDIEQIIRKVAEENKIENIESLQIQLSKDNGVVKFAIIDDWEDIPEDFGENLDEDSGEDSEEDSEEESSYGPYRFNIYYNIVTPESAEIGDFEESGNEVLDGYAEDMDDLINQLEDYGFAQDNNSTATDRLSFDTVDPVQDRAHFEEGEDKYYTVFIEREDDEDFEQKEVDTIKQRLGVR